MKTSGLDRPEISLALHTILIRAKRPVFPSKCRAKVDMEDRAENSAPELRVAKKFRLIRKIGQGSFGEIFLGKYVACSVGPALSNFHEIFAFQACMSGPARRLPSNSSLCIAVTHSSCTRRRSFDTSRVVWAYRRFTCCAYLFSLISA